MRFENVLKVENIALKRGERLLVKNLSFELKPAAALALRGPNGSGKSTLLKAIAGLHQPLAGKITISGTDEDSETKDFLSYLGHNDGIKANETIIRQLNFWADIFSKDKNQIIPICEQLDIKKLIHLPGGVLSAGQKRRTALARLLLQGRPLWLLDEPFAPLDENGRKILGQILDNHRKSGGIILAAVHDTPFGEKMDELWLIDKTEVLI